MDTISVTLLGGGDHACAHYVTKAVKNFKKILINFLVLHIKIKDPIVISLSKKKKKKDPIVIFVEMPFLL
jgi:hypothetical protein